MQIRQTLISIDTFDSLDAAKTFILGAQKEMRIISARIESINDFTRAMPPIYAIVLEVSSDAANACTSDITINGTRFSSNGTIYATGGAVKYGTPPAEVCKANMDHFNKEILSGLKPRPKPAPNAAATVINVTIEPTEEVIDTIVEALVKQMKRGGMR